MAFNGVNENDVQVPQQNELIDYLNFLPSDGEIHVSSLKTMKAIGSKPVRALPVGARCICADNT